MRGDRNMIEKAGRSALYRQARRRIFRGFLCLAAAFLLGVVMMLTAGQVLAAEAGDPGRITPEKKAASQTGMVSSSLRRRAQQNAAQRKVVGYGIDVSYWQGNIDWSKVKADGVTFAFIRVAYRTYGSSGTLNADTKAKQNIEGAKAVGIKVGVYCFSTAISEKEALEEARFTLDMIRGYKLELPVVYDCEGYAEKEYRNYSSNPSSASNVRKRTDRALAFMEYVESQGYEAMMYNSAGHMLNNTYWDMSRIENKYGIWMAQYYYQDEEKNELMHDFKSMVAKPSWYTGPYRFWQGTCSGKINGIKEGVDLNLEYEMVPPAANMSYPMAVGWGKDASGGKYYTIGGKRVTGLQRILDNTYYFNEAGIMQTGPQQINGQWYVFDPVTGALQKNCFQKIKTASGGTITVYYGSNGEKYTGSHKIDGYYYYFRESDGAMLTSCFKTLKNSSGTKYKVYYGEDGRRYKGSHQINGEWYYFKSSGAMLKKKWKTLKNSKGKKYKVYYNKKGIRLKGMQKVGKYWYYFSPGSGAMAKKKWKKITTEDGLVYKTYFKSNGRRASGWLKIKKKWYLFDKATGMIVS